jgi:hypothetical protein
VKTKPKDIGKVFHFKKAPRVDTLGFGYTYAEGSAGKEYVSCFYSLLLRYGKPVSFRLEPQVPDQSSLQRTYLKFYAPLFEVDTVHGSVTPYTWNPDSACEPLADPRFLLRTQGSPNPRIRELMSPFVGIAYGITGGIAGTELANRQAFEALKDRLTDRELTFLLHSVNPATRLMAIEYLDGPGNHHALPVGTLAREIAFIYNEHPFVLTYRGCIVGYGEARALVKDYRAMLKKSGQ